MLNAWRSWFTPLPANRNGAAGFGLAKRRTDSGRNGYLVPRDIPFGNVSVGPETTLLRLGPNPLLEGQPDRDLVAKAPIASGLLAKLSMNWMNGSWVRNGPWRSLSGPDRRTAAPGRVGLDPTFDHYLVLHNKVQQQTRSHADRRIQVQMKCDKV